MHGTRVTCKRVVGAASRRTERKECLPWTRTKNWFRITRGSLRLELACAPPYAPAREARACRPTGASQCTRAGPRARRDDRGQAQVPLFLRGKVCWSGITPNHNLTGFVQRGFRVGRVPCVSWKGSRASPASHGKRHRLGHLWAVGTPRKRRFPIVGAWTEVETSGYKCRPVMPPASPQGPHTMPDGCYHWQDAEASRRAHRADLYRLPFGTRIQEKGPQPERQLIGL